MSFGQDDYRTVTLQGGRLKRERIHPWRERRTHVNKALKACYAESFLSEAVADLAASPTHIGAVLRHPRYVVRLSASYSAAARRVARHPKTTQRIFLAGKRERLGYRRMHRACH
jgi:hypothetical protein